MNSPDKSWINTLHRFAERSLGDKAGGKLLKKYHALLTDFYQSLVSPRYALRDMLQLEKIAVAECHRVSLLNPCQCVEDYRLHFYSRQERYLDEYIPLLENLHLRVMDQVQFAITVDKNTLYIKSFTIKTAISHGASLTQLKKRMLNAIQAIMDEKAENDTLNKLIVLTGMTWQQVDLLRAYRNYYLQLGLRTTRNSIHHALIHHPDVSRCLYNYFDARFRPNTEWNDPLLREEQALFPIRAQLLDNMASVSDINDDRILRTLFNFIDATMRCNFHMRLSRDDYFIAFKINSLGIIDMPSPRPLYEVYVHAFDMEGIHLRAGKVSRGGIRWSDRPDDFRTEILDLMQTQISKNALIIPTGAKGGFVLKMNGSGVDVKQAGKIAYTRLIRGLLDLTDNYVEDNIVQPQHLVTYDDPDPYLVVAADKGTAQFSDIANSISKEYQFWLGDAFASGGSLGYNHKALGITARGAWECVKRHFREVGKDIQNEAFTVVGIGSMDGDVFGNGMLLSPCIRLLAAFSGQHIFIDPDPANIGASFNERKRLFELPGSSWEDYDRTLISNGGGVYLRSSKDIPVSPELKKWLGIRYKSLDGESLIRYLLRAPVELLWLGGIGTYVKAGTEKHEDVGDRANDNVRIDAAELGAQIVGEGANLGFTQSARIEYSLSGGRINTDAVDNSAGVDTSDHEVNLKILLTGLQKRNLITDYRPLFADMTEQVCDLVLADNYAQSLCLSLEQLRSAENSSAFLQIAEHLESAGLFDRASESFPSVKEVLSRPGKLLTRPELAVLMSASKLYLTQLIQNQTSLLQETCCGSYLKDYFPDQLINRYQDHLSEHPLAEEIKATVASNKIINQAGSSFLNLPIDIDKANTLDHVSCYLTFDRALEVDALRQALYALDNELPADQQYQLLMLLEKTLAGFCRWALSHEKTILPNDQTIQAYKQYLKDYENYFKAHDCLEVEVVKAQLLSYSQVGIPNELAQKIVFISRLESFPYIHSLTVELSRDFVTVLTLFNAIWELLGLDAVHERLQKLSGPGRWEKTVAVNLIEDIKHFTCLIIKKIMALQVVNCAEYFDTPAERPKLNRYRRIYQDVIDVMAPTLLPFSVLAKELEKLSEKD